MASKGPPQFGTTINEYWQLFLKNEGIDPDQGEEISMDFVKRTFYLGAAFAFAIKERLENSELSDEAIQAIDEGLEAEIRMQLQMSEASLCQCPRCVARRAVTWSS